MKQEKAQHGHGRSLTAEGTGIMLGGNMKGLFFLASLLCWAVAPLVQAKDVILTGGVALRSWENYRGPAAHDNWWANFVRASTIEMELLRQKDANADIVWIVFRPSYLTRSKENKTEFIPKIEETAKKYRVKLQWVDTAEAAWKAIAGAARKEPIRSFYYFGHSNPHAFMLDYSNRMIGASMEWMHEKDIEKYLSPQMFAPDAYCISYGCYTGQSMSGYWHRATKVHLWGNTESTRYQPVGEGKLPSGAGRWTH